jgi:hypothetical protein
MDRLRAMPLFLRIILVFTAVFSCVATVIVILGVLGVLDYNIGNYATTRDEWLRLALPLWIFLILAMGGIAFALWTRKTWARHLVMLMWIVLGIYALTLYFTLNLKLEVMLSTLARVLVLGGFCLWYLYRKANVVTYFAQLQPG